MDIYTKNFPYTYFKLEIDPSHNLVEDDHNQLVRFQLKSDQYIDFDTAYLEVTISVADYDLAFPAGYTTAQGTKYGLALDGASTSLINNFKLYSNGRLVEHIVKYREIGMIAHSLNLMPQQREGRACQGLGNGSYKYTTPVVKTNAVGNTLNAYYYDGTNYKIDRDYFGFSPSYAYYPIKKNTIPQTLASNQVGDFYSAPKFYSAIALFNNAYYGSKIANRTPYAIWSRVYGGDYGLQRADHTQYNFGLNTLFAADQPTTTNYTVSVQTNRYIVERGYQVPYSPYLENPNKDVVLEPGVRKYLINNGKYINVPGIQDVVVFKVPFLSSTLGVFRTGHKGLVDGNLLGQLNFEWRFDENGFYVTGMGSEDLSGGTSGMAFKKLYKIKRCRMILDTYHPSYTPKQALGPNQFWANAWTCGHNQVFNNTALLNADHQINVGIKSARLMLTYFNLQDYTDPDKTFCRAFYPISGNVTSYQVKMNSLLFPVNPVQGHAGNPYMNSTQTVDNTEFVDYFNRAMGTFMGNSRCMWTNNISYAPNERPYNTGNDVVTQNTEKIGGGTFFLEQKIPRCFYVTRFDDQDGMFVRNMSNAEEYDYGWNGVDTTELRPFTLALKTDQANYNNTPVELNIFFYHDCVVKYTREGIFTEGLYLQ